MKKYYIFAVALSAAVLALVAAVLIYDAPQRHDRVMYKTVYRAIQDVDAYVQADRQRGIPTSLDAVYAKNAPTSVTYSRVNDKLYTVCASFNQDYAANSSYNSYGYEDTQYQSSQTYVQQQNIADPQTKYWVIGSYMSSYDAHYKAGRNCFVGQPVTDDAIDGSVDPYAPGRMVD